MASVKKRAGYGFEVRYIDPATGKRPSKTFQLKKDADAFKRKVEREIEAGEHVSRGASVTVAAARDEYVASLDRRQREGTYRDASYRKETSHLRVHIMPKFGKRLLLDLAEADADRFFAELRDQGLSTETVAAIFASLSRLIDFGIRRGWVKRNVARTVRAWPENRLGATDPIRRFDMDQARILFDYFQDATARNPKWSPRYASMGRAIVYLGMFLGLRSGEVRGLTWDAVDFEADTIRIEQALDENRHVAPTKNRQSVRGIPLLPVLREALEDWRRFAMANDAGLVFTTKRATPVSAQDLHNHIWKRALADLGYSGADAGGWPHFHALRHLASSLMQQYMPVADVSPLLGHKDVRTTLGVYTGATLPKLAVRQALTNMSAALLLAPAARTIDAGCDALVTQTA